MTKEPCEWLSFKNQGKDDLPMMNYDEASYAEFTLFLDDLNGNEVDGNGCEFESRFTTWVICQEVSQIQKECGPMHAWQIFRGLCSPRCEQCEVWHAIEIGEIGYGQLSLMIRCIAMKINHEGFPVFPSLHPSKPRNWNANRWEDVFNKDFLACRIREAFIEAESIAHHRFNEEHYKAEQPRIVRDIWRLYQFLCIHRDRAFLREPPYSRQS